jgi:CHAD domain-containing protein
LTTAITARTRTPPPATIGSLAVQVLAQHAGAFVAHAPGVRTGSAPRHVHQMRVATRRMRAALRLFDDVLPADAHGLATELRWIAGQLGPVRDLDVQRARLRDAGAELGLADSLEPYAAWLDQQWQSAHSCLRDALRSERFSILVHRFTQFDDWSPEPASELPLVEEAARRLRKAYRSLKERAEPLTEDARAADLHQTRIRAKRLRYATEFFEPIYGQPAARLVERTVALQDLLGGLQDTAVAAERIHQAAHVADSRLSFETALALGRVLQYDEQRAQKLRKGFPGAYRDVRASWQRLRRALEP